MSVHPSRVVASALFVAGGVVSAVFALAIALAKILVDGGMAVRQTDAAVLADLTSLLVFVVAFAGLNVLAAAGLLAGKTWADSVAMSTSAVAVGIGATGLILIVAGGDPSQLASQATIDGITILGAFTILYVAVITALNIQRLPGQASPIGATA